jgi:hypothetical protein
VKKYYIRIALITVFTLLLASCGGGAGGGKKNTGLDSIAALSKLIPPGEVCPSGGAEVETGVDVNENGLLDPDEVTNTETICNGSNGFNSMVMFSTEPEGSNCELGGIRIIVGLDSDEDSFLEDSEVTDTDYLCAIGEVTRPAIVGAISTSSTTVRVSFSKAMDDTIADASKYVITQEVINTEVGTLIIKSADFPDDGGEHYSIILTTSPQNEVTYRVKGSGLKDIDGNPLPGIIEVPGGTLDTTSVTFAGSAPGLTVIDASFWNDVNSNNIVDGGDIISDANGQQVTLFDVDNDGVVENWNDNDNSGGVTPADTVTAFLDSDGDGLPDHIELYGSIVDYVKSDGVTVSVSVTSDPNIADSDGDGINDFDEAQYNTNPRRKDTDLDGLNDYFELNAIYSIPYKADSDGDGLEDGLEFNTLQTSPIHADTDGDQMDDNVELFERYRNPRIADLPELSLIPGNHSIILNEVFTYTDSQGNEVIQESSSTAQLATRSGVEVLEIDETVEEVLNAFEIKGTVRGGLSESDNGMFPYNSFIWGQVEIGYTRQWNNITTTGTNTTSIRESQQVLEDSYAKTESFNTVSEVVRDVQNAIINVGLSLRNQSDIAFSVSDIEVAMYRIKPGNAGLEPLATLVSSSGVSASYYLGPESEIGPLVFTNENFSVGLAEELMRNPGSILFQIVNFSIADEFGRQFSYINQQVQDVTSALVVDYGFEGVDNFQMATSAKRDLGTGQALGLFNAQGKPSGLPLTYLLESELGWERNPTTPDAVIAGIEGISQTAALGDDIQRVNIGTRGLGIGEVIVEAGPNGVLDSFIDADSQNRIAVTSGFDTSATCGVDSPVIFQGRKACSINSECTCTVENGCPDEILADADAGNAGFANAQCDGPQIITRIGGYQNNPGSYRWVALTDADLSTSADVDSIMMKPGQSFKLAFVQDLDEDGLFGRQEFMAGSTDSPVNREDNTEFGDIYRIPAPDEATACGFQQLPYFCGEESNQSVRIPLADSRDTDRDGMEDASELNLGWEVAVNGQARRKVFSSPTLRDSDGDGLTDWQERDIRFSCGFGFYLAGVNRQVEGNYYGPFRQGEFTFNENTIVSYPVEYENQRILYIDPFGSVTNPADLNSGDDFSSQAMDYQDVSNLLYINKVAPYCQPDELDPTTENPDDYVSRAVGLDPQNPDTDGDGVTDGAELMGYKVGEALIARLDFKTYSDSIEAARPKAEWESILPFSFVARGDDVLVRDYSLTVKSGDVIMLPGQNGVLDADYESIYSITFSDGLISDPLSIRPAQVVRSNPLSHDTDGDLLSDGAERLLGTNPVLAGDVGDIKDSDGDGVFDVDESRGLAIQVNGATLIVRSNPALADSDGDGLPDFVEYQIGSNPSSQDTDADGLSDYDELGAGGFQMYAGYSNRIENFILDASMSQKYGTLLTDRDSDNDGLDDGEEVAGFSLVTLQNGVAVSLYVSTNPLSDDSDGDGLSDNVELTSVRVAGSPDKMTHPLIADTDADGIGDGDEVDRDTNPLVPDRRVTVRFYEVSLFDSVEINSDWDWELRIRAPGETEPGVVVNTDNHATSCLGVVCTHVPYIGPFGAPNVDYGPLQSILNSYMTIPVQYHLSDIGSTAFRTFTVAQGEDLSLSGILLQYDGNNGLYGCRSEFTENYTFDDLVSQPQINRVLNVSENTCSVSVRYTIETTQ